MTRFIAGHVWLHHVLPISVPVVAFGIGKTVTWLVHKLSKLSFCSFGVSGVKNVCMTWSLCMSENLTSWNQLRYLSACIFLEGRVLSLPCYVFSSRCTSIPSWRKDHGSEKPMEVCTEDIIKNVEALCVPSLFKHRWLSLPTVRTLQGRALRSKEIKNKRTPNCCVW